MKQAIVIATAVLLLGSTAALARSGWAGAGLYAWFTEPDEGPTIYAGPFATEQECKAVADAAPKKFGVACRYFASQAEWDNF